MKALKLFLLGITLGLAVAGQAQQPTNPTQVQVQRSGDNPLYKITVNVVERTTKAINYRHHTGSTKIDFRGMPLLPEACGEAKVKLGADALATAGPVRRKAEVGTDVLLRSAVFAYSRSKGLFAGYLA